MVNFKIKASLDRSDYEKGLDAMKAAAKGLNSSLQGLGSVGGVIAGVLGGNFITGAVSRAWDMIRSSISEARQEMVKLGRDSENIGIAPRELDEIVDAFERYGVSGEEVVSMFGRMETARNKALSGDDKAVKQFDDLGKSLEDITKLNPNRLFEDLLGAYAKAGGSGSVAEAMQDIFGKGMRSAAMQRASKSYGIGGRNNPFIDINDDDIIVATMAERQNSLRMKSVSNLWTRVVGFLSRKPGDAQTVASTLLPQFLAPAKAVQSFLGVDETEVQVEKGKAAKAERLKGISNDAAAKASGAKKKKMESDLETEDQRHEAVVLAERKDEIERGIRIQRPESDAYRRRGIAVGGGFGNDQAYQNGRRQLQLSVTLVDLTRQIVANTKEQKLHKANVDKIKEAE